MKKIISLMLTFIMLLSIPMMSIAAKSQSEMKSEINANQDEIKNTEKEQAAVREQLSAAMQEVSELTNQIKEYESEIGALNLQISSLEDEIKESEKQIKVAQEKCDEQDDLMKKRLVTIYELGTYSYLDVLLKSASLTELISNYYLITEMAEKDAELLEQLETSKKDLEDAKQRLEDSKKAIQDVKQEKQEKSNALTEAKAQKDEQVSKLNSEEKELQNKIDEYEANIAELEAQIRKAEAEAAKASSSSSSSGTFGSVSSSYNGSGMIWPTPGCKYITSPFGYRIHPVYGYRTFHSGIDIGASYGSRIVAAQDGVVTLASYNGGYGNCVMINHGGGISTLYAHGSQIVVSSGQSVKQGETIMYVGSTGVSTGPHLHFEVRKNGSYTQPLDYLP